MAFSESLAARIRDALPLSPAITEKKMFGGIGFFLNGNMLAGILRDSMIVRLGPEQGHDALQEPHVREFNITGKSMKNWIIVDPDGIDSDRQLQNWIDRARAFVRTLPAK